MVEARGSGDDGPVNNPNVVELSSHDIIESKLLTTLNSIDPKQLGTTSHEGYIRSLAAILTSLLEEDYTQLLLFVQAIKDCGKACYKRDVLIETLNVVFLEQKDQQILLKILCDINHQNDGGDFLPWKEMANALVTLPDLIANCGCLHKFPGFVPKNFYRKLLTASYSSLTLVTTDKKDNHPTNLRKEIAFFYAHLIGRIAIAGFGTLVWNKITSRLVAQQQQQQDHNDLTAKNLVSTILCIPARVAEFEIFIEPLYGPIFYYMRPSLANGRLIKSLIGSSLLHNETLEHIVCKKYILQANFNHDRHRQNLILYNIFAYLSCLASNDGNGGNDDDAEEDEDNNKLTMQTTAATTSDTSEMPPPTSGARRLHSGSGSNVLIDTLLEVAKSWSNSTKILLRSYEQNRYIGCALVMGLKFALEGEEHKLHLLKKADAIQSEVIRGLQIYLNRSSSELRNVAMCVGEIALTRLHDLIDAETMKGDSSASSSSKKSVPLKLDIEWDESSLGIKKVIQLDQATFCTELDASIAANSSHDNSDSDDDGDAGDNYYAIKVNRCRTIVNENDDGRHQSRAAATATTTTEAASDGKTDNDEDDAGDEDRDGEDSMDAPIYLNDCISGLIDNDKPRYVKICLTKIGVLIRQNSKTEEQQQLQLRGERQASCSDRKVSNYRSGGGGESSKQTAKNVLKKATTNDAIRDVAIELAQVLLYLEDQYSVDNFDGLQRSALVALAVAAPDLVAKYLLDELNKDQILNIRMHTIILQTLVESAQQLGNRFTKYGALYFYGIVHQLKLSTSASASVCLSRTFAPQRSSFSSSTSSSLPSTSTSTSATLGSIVSAVKSMKADQEHDQRQLDDDDDDELERQQRKRQHQRQLEDSELIASDDSYLLSRVLLSVSLIIKCLNQQLITCKLSNDLLDILAAYRHHPDSGVRKAILSCLTVIRDCTPSVYFTEQLSDKTAALVMALGLVSAEDQQRQYQLGVYARR